MVGTKRRFGEVAVELGYITEEQLRRAVRKQRAIRKTRIGELLVELGALDASELAIALQQRGKSARPFGAFLLEARAVTREQLGTALEVQERRRKQRLGEVLVESGDLDEVQLHAVLEELNEK